MSVKGGSNLQLKRRKISVLTSTQNRNLQETSGVWHTKERWQLQIINLHFQRETSIDYYVQFIQQQLIEEETRRKIPIKELLHRNLSRRINLFASLCKLHQEQKSVTNHCKKPILTPIKANQFLGYIQMDLIDCCNLPCECHLWHLWVLHVVDYYTKFSWLFALKNKQTEEVAGTLTNFFWMFGSIITSLRQWERV